MSVDRIDLKNIIADAFAVPDSVSLHVSAATHRPRILLLYGSLRERSFSRFLTQEAARLLETFGAEARIFNPSGLPLPDDAPADHSQSSGAARSLGLVGRSGVVESGTPRRDDRHHESAD